MKKKIFIILGAVSFWTLWSSRAKKHKTIPCFPGYNIYFGHLLTSLKLIKNESTHDFYKNEIIKNHFTLVHFTRCFRNPNVFINDPDIIQQIFEVNFNDAIKGERIHDLLYPLLGDGIFSSDPPKWKVHRKVASQMFSMRNLKYYEFGNAKEHSKIWCDKVLELSQMPQFKTQGIDISELLARYTLDVFVKIAFGQSLNLTQQAPLIQDDFGRAFDETQQFLSFRFINPLWKIQQFFKIGYEKKLDNTITILNNFANKVISERRDKSNLIYNENGEEVGDLLSLFLHNDPNLTTKKLRDIAMNFVLAGRDTTRILLSWFFYELSLNQDIYNKIFDEIIDVAKEENCLLKDNVNRENLTLKDIDIDQLITYDTINKKFSYLEACLLETLRLHPPVPFLVRSATHNTVLTDKKENKEYKILKGEQVFVHTYSYMRTPAIWGPNASEFNPDKFVKNGINSYPPHVFIAFNIAPRLCLGRHIAIVESKVLALRFLINFKYQVLPNQQIIYDQGILLTMKNAFNVHITKR